MKTPRKTTKTIDETEERENNRITCWRNIGVSSRFAKCIFSEIVLEFCRERDRYNGWFPREKEKGEWERTRKWKKKLMNIIYINIWRERKKTVKRVRFAIFHLCRSLEISRALFCFLIWIVAKTMCLFCVDWSATKRRGKETRVALSHGFWWCVHASTVFMTLVCSDYSCIKNGRSIHRCQGKKTTLMPNYYLIIYICISQL